MQWGALAIIDVLGFKGIWRRGHDADCVLASLSSVRTASENAKKLHEGTSGGDLWDFVSFDFRMFSDTLYISTFLPPANPDYTEAPGYQATQRYMLLRSLVLLVSQSLTQGICSQVPLLYRGAVSVGEFRTSDIAFIGPAVDDAGSQFEAADGAFVFLTPSAATVYRQRPWLMSLPLPYFFPYEVPLKNSPVLNTFCLNPFFYAAPEDYDRLLQRLLSEFGDSPQLATKRANTASFLQLAKDAARQYRNA